VAERNRKCLFTACSQLCFVCLCARACDLALVFLVAHTCVLSFFLGGGYELVFESDRAGIFLHKAIYIIWLCLTGGYVFLSAKVKQCTIDL